MREKTCNLCDKKGRLSNMCRGDEKEVAEEVAEEIEETVEPPAPAPRPKLFSFAKDVRGIA